MKRCAGFFSFMFFSVFASGVLAAQDQSLMTSDEALNLLQAGNMRFVNMALRHPNQSAERRADTAYNGQKPFAAVLSCSDSRVPPEIIFDRGIGDIFVARVAGNIAADASIVGSIEYAVRHLSVPLLVVMGHTKCGAVDAAISGMPVEGSIRYIRKKIEPVVTRVRIKQPSVADAALLDAVIKSNAIQAKADLLSRSAVLKQAASEGRLKVAVCVYDIDSGIVTWEQ